MKKWMMALVVAAAFGGGVAMATATVQKANDNAGCGRVDAACGSNDDCCESFYCNSGKCTLKGGK